MPVLHKGFIEKNKGDHTDTISLYVNDSEINNIHAIFGTHAQADDKEVYVFKPNSHIYKLFHNNSHDNNKSFDGHSLAAVFISLDGS